MAHTVIQASVADQDLALSIPTVLAAGGVDENLVAFTFCPLWEGLTKTAVFYCDPDHVHHVPLVDDICTVPAELTEQPCKLFVGVVGISGQHARTSVMRALRFKPSAECLTK